MKARGYAVQHIKISTLFTAEAGRQNLSLHPSKEDSAEFNRIWSLQTLGNELRQKLGEDAGAQLAMQSIATHRASLHPEVAIAEIKPGRVAYIVDQLKNPLEVLLLRRVYRNLFYMVGVLCSYESRKSNLVRRGISRALAEKVMERDRRESDDNGQQLDKTLHHAEFFVSNSRHNLSELGNQIDRFVGLIHGDNGITPSIHERGMFAAFSASLQSACLSRQVGAAIADSSGNVIATGCNDVPRAGGGLYEPGPGDMRCVVRDRYCHNDRKKSDLLREVKNILIAQGILPVEAERVAEIIRKSTRIKDLIEFSRAVHAEMDAIVSVARTGAAKIQGGVMYTTTYPCHSCARHIVAAGIMAVYFIEPYEKSLAIELHDDAIVQEPDRAQAANDESQNKVSFLHFEGVSPHKFTKLFHSPSSRKSGDGRAFHHIPDAMKKVPEYLDDYIELETRVIEKLQKSVPGQTPPLPLPPLPPPTPTAA